MKSKILKSLGVMLVVCLSYNANATKKRIGCGTNIPWNQADSTYLVAFTIYQYHYSAHVGDTLLLVLEYAGNGQYLNFYDFPQQNTYQPFPNSFNIPNQVKNISISPDTSLMVLNGLPSNGEIVFEFTNVAIQLIVHITTLPTAIKESSNQFTGLAVFPNPTKDILSLTAKAQHIQIINSVGESVFVEENTNQINVSDFRPGIYFVIINGFKKIKFIKQ